jgi:hypothetical protein
MRKAGGLGLQNIKSTHYLMTPGERTSLPHSVVEVGGKTSKTLGLLTEVKQKRQKKKEKEKEREIKKDTHTKRETKREKERKRNWPP